MSAPEQVPEKNAKGFREALEVSPVQAALYVGDVHAADVAGWLQDVDEGDAWQVFAELEVEFQADVLEYSEESLTNELVGRMSAGDLREVVEEMPSDEAVDLLAEADERVAEDVLKGLDLDTARELRELSAYDPETAGGMMATEFVTVPEDVRIGDAVKAIRKLGEDAEEDLGVYVIDENGVPVGYLDDRALLTHPIHDPVQDVMVRPFTLPLDTDQEEVARRIDKYQLHALAVVDESGALQGVISAEDALEILGEETEEDILRMVGTAPTQQQTRLPVLIRVRQRMPLMGLTVVAGLVSAKILRVIAADSVNPTDVHGGGPGQIADILRYLPLIIGLAGNVGVQSSTILVRAFATGEVTREREPSVLAGEVTVGVLIGLLCGALTLLMAAWLEGSGDTLYWAFGASVGAAITVAVATAASLGCLIPMGCRRMGIDPAIVAGPFLISISDVAGSAIYILVAKALLFP